MQVAPCAGLAVASVLILTTPRLGPVVLLAAVIVDLVTSQLNNGRSRG
jgi:hypothetical protein